MLKDIVAYLPLGETAAPVVDLSVSMAGMFDAHVEGIAFVYQPVVTTMAYGAIPADVIAWQREEGERQARMAFELFETATRAAGVKSSTQSFQAAPGSAGDMFAEIARRYDLAVIGQPDPQKPGYDDVGMEASLFGSGRPVVVVPYIHKGPLKLDRVALCWDGSRTAARAIGDAMPLLKRAKAIDVVMVTKERAKSDDVPGADLATHLARHGLPVELHRLSAGSLDVFNTILSFVADASSDFMVMGGYGHSRLREFVLGGVTRGILQSLTVPTLMSH